MFSCTHTRTHVYTYAHSRLLSFGHDDKKGQAIDDKTLPFLLTVYKPGRSVFMYVCLCMCVRACMWMSMYVCWFVDVCTRGVVSNASVLVNENNYHFTHTHTHTYSPPGNTDAAAIPINVKLRFQSFQVMLSPALLSFGDYFKAAMEQNKGGTDLAVARRTSKVSVL
jgi:hypothetical protein